MNRKSLFVTSAFAAVTLFGGSAFAADAVATAPAPDEPIQTAQAQDDSELSGVIVQVNKRNEAIEDVPVAVTAFSTEQRDLLGVVSIFDFTRATPSFEYTTALDRAFIRGVGRNTNAPGTQAGVALYVDGVYTSSTYGLDRAPILSGTYEADAGPQGTLFGRNSIGGVLQQNSAHATDEFQIKTDLRYNDHNRFDGAISIGGPVGEHFKVLVGADYRKQTEGYFRNLALPGDDTAGPTTERLYFGMFDYKFGKIDGFLKLEASGFNRKLSQYSQYGSNYLNLPRFNNDTSVTTNFLSVNQFFNCVRVAGVCGATAPQTSTQYNNTNYTALDNYVINVDYRTSAKSDRDYNVTNQTTWHLPWFDLKYIGGYTQYIYDNHQDGDGTARGAFSYDPDGSGFFPAARIQPQVINYFEDRKWQSHEFDFSSNGDGNLNWIFGLYYYHDNFLNRYTQGAPDQAELQTPYAIIGGVPTALTNANPGRNYVYLNYDAITESKAAFGQVEYKFTPKLTLTAGLRYNRDDVTTTENDHYYSFIPASSAYNGAGGYVAFDGTSSILATCTPAGVPAIATTGAKCTATVDIANSVNQRVISDGWTGYGGTVNLSYKPSEDTLAYAKYSRGYKAGGIVSSSMAVQPILDPESLNAYEVGYKFNPSRKLTLNTAFYYYDYRNYQDFGSVRNVAAPSGFSTVGFNIPKSRNYGAELTALWHPTSHFTVTMTGNYMNAKVVDGGSVTLADNLDLTASGQTVIKDSTGAVVQTFTYTPQPCGAVSPTTVAGVVVNRQPQCITGTTLKGASPWKVWITPDYRFDFEKGSLDLLATYSWRAGNVSAYSNNPVYEAPAYSEVDLRAVWQSDNSKFRVIGFINNVFNEQGTEFVLPALNTSTGDMYIQNVLTIPRTWGIELQAKF